MQHCEPLVLRSNRDMPVLAQVIEERFHEATIYLCER